MGIDGSFWRAITVFRVASLCYAVLLLATADGYSRPGLGWVVIGLMAAWTVVTAVAYPRHAGWPLLAADLGVTLGCLVSTPLVQGAVTAAPPITATWVAGPVLAWAVCRGRRAGIMVGAVTAVADLGLHGLSTASWKAVSLNGAVLLLLTGLVVGHVARLAHDAEERLQRASRAEAATRERERLARGIHDSVLQVLALVQRRGLDAGGEAAELGRLAGEQERALRELVGSRPSGVAAGLVDLAVLLRRHGGANVTVSTAATSILLPTVTAEEVAAAVGAALDNVERHCGPRAKAWVFAEVCDASMIVSVRDDGPGIPDGRLRAAAAQGRLGVAQSIVGRIEDLGGTATVVSAPGQGTEVELTVPLGAGPIGTGP